MNVPVMRCHLPWTQAFINANGMIAPCCAPLELGNLADARIAEVFTGTQYRTLQADLAAGRKTAATRYCDNCYALRKFKESGYTFASAGLIGSDTEAALTELASSHPGFVSNYRLVRDAYLAGTALPSHARPLRLELQLGEHCDIRCIMCWQDHAHPRALRRETYGAIGELLPYAQDVVFTGGEPTIYKGFWQLVAQFKEVANPYARLHILTHGLHLKENLHRFEGIRQLGFCVNVDGPTRETYEKIRARASWKKLNDSLKAVSDARTRHRGWGLNTTFLLMRSNIELIDESIAFANRYDAQWSCGMIAGEYLPIAQCRTYFNENIFRFGHLGYSVEHIVNLLAASAPQASRNSTLAGATLEATIQQVRATTQIQIPPATVAELDGLSDLRELSRRIRLIIVADSERTRPTREHLETALTDAEREHGTQSAAYANAVLALGKREEELLEFTAAVDHLRAGIAICERNTSWDPAEVAEAKSHLGRCLTLAGDRTGTAFLKDAWAQMRTSVGHTNARTAQAALELGKALNRQQLYANAAPALEDAYRIFSVLHADQDDSSYVAVSASELGTCYLELGREKAEALLKQALQMYEAMWGRDSSLAIDTAEKLMRIYVASGRRRDARMLHERCPGCSAPEFGTPPRIASYDEACVAETKLHLGRCLAMSGAPAATAVLKDAWLRTGNVHGPASAQTAQAALELGKALSAQKRHGEASSALEEAYRIFSTLHAGQADSSYVAVSASELGICYLELGRPEAAALLEQALQMFEAVWGGDSSLAIVTARKLMRIYTGPSRHHDANAPLDRGFGCKYAVSNLVTRIARRLVPAAKNVSRRLARRSA